MKPIILSFQEEFWKSVWLLLEFNCSRIYVWMDWRIERLQYEIDFIIYKNVLLLLE